MELRDTDGDPTPLGLAAGGAVVVVVATGGAAVAADSSQWIAPLLTLIGAVFVAVLTAVTTNRRQAKQLAAEQRRQRLELAHARDLAELAHLRDFFDDAAAALEVRRDTLDAYSWAIRHWLESEDLDEQTLDAPSTFVIDAGRAVAIVYRRLLLRLPVDHPVSVAFDDTEDALADRYERLGDMADARNYDEEQADQLAVDVMAAWAGFVEAARTELDRRAATAE